MVSSVPLRSLLLESLLELRSRTSVSHAGSPEMPVSGNGKPESDCMFPSLVPGHVIRNVHQVRSCDKLLKHASACLVTSFPPPNSQRLKLDARSKS